MSNNADALLVVIPGPKLRFNDQQDLRDQLAGLLQDGHVNLVLDFSRLEFVDSSFLGFMVILLKKSTAVGGDVRVCCLQDSICDIFNLMRLDRVFQIFDSSDEALASFH